MPTYSEIGAELANVPSQEHLLWLSLNLRKMLAEMEQATKRPVVMYEANHRVRHVAQAAQMAEKVMVPTEGVPGLGPPLSPERQRELAMRVRT